MITHGSDDLREPTPDERRADWAYRYYAGGHHLMRGVKPRIRVPHTQQQMENKHERSIAPSR